MTDWLAELKTMEPCAEAWEWVQPYPTLQAAWDACEEPSWMCWFLGQVGVARRRLVAMELDMARTVEHLSPVARACNAVTARWLAGRATLDELRTARDAAAAAAYAAADAAAAAVYATTAYDAVAYVDAAVYAADAAAIYADVYATYATRVAKRRECVAIIRQHFPVVEMPSQAEGKDGTA